LFPFFMSGLHPCAPQAADALPFARAGAVAFGAGALNRSTPASTTGWASPVSPAAIAAVAATEGVGGTISPVLDAAALVSAAGMFVSGAPAAGSLLLHPEVTAFTERTARAARMLSNESDLPISRS